MLAARRIESSVDAAQIAVDGSQLDVDHFGCVEQ
jgi:hypothetical protein